MIASSPQKNLKKVARVLPAAALCLFALPASAANILTNGTFDTAKDPWWGNASTTSDPPADQTIAVEEGKLCSTQVSGGKNPWDVVLGVSGVPLVAGKYYRIAFSASADVERTIKYKTGLGEAPYSDYFAQTITISPTPKDFEVTYKNVHEDPMGQFQFQIGKTAGKVCIDNVVIEEVAEPVLPAYMTPSITTKPFKAYEKVVKMGTAVDTPIFLSSPKHNQIVENEFSAITPANSMKMNLIQPTQGTFDFVDTDALYSWAQAKGLEFRGHPLVWHTQAPSWIQDDTTLTRDQMIGLMNAHIDGLMGHYPNLPYWDVVNEAIEFSNGVPAFRSTFWHDRIGDDFVDLAFQRARMADADTKLFYNDYNIEQAGEAKSDRVFQMIQDMKMRGIPIDGVGLQSHYFVTPDGGLSGVPNIDAIRANIKRYADIGVEVHITECDFRLGKPLDDSKLALHTKFFSELLQACIDAENCTHFTVWGLSDIDSWVPSTFPDYDYAHLFDSAFAPRPAYQEMNKIFAKYNPDDGTLLGGTGGTGGGTGGTGTAGSGSGAVAETKDSGCSVARASGVDATGAGLALLALLGLSLVSRRAAKPD